MGRKANYSIKLTDEQRSEVKRIIDSSSKKISVETKSRAKALFHLDESGENPLSPEKTAAKAKLHRETVYGIRKQFVTSGLEATLHRKEREVPAIIPKVTGDVEAHIIACACSSAPDGKSHWTMQMIADKIVLDGVIDSISDETVRRVLKKQNSNRI
jgi:hypothetical protein